jgi:hypothetical protein
MYAENLSLTFKVKVYGHCYSDRVKLISKPKL